MTIWFDMDGSIADFYGVDGWLDSLINENPRPYIEAKPLFNFSSFAKQIHRLQNMGIEVGIISWLSKTSTKNFDKAVTYAKMEWLSRHLPSVQFNKIHIVSYGTPKQNFSNCLDDILFDDEEQNRKNWRGIAYDVGNILEVLRGIR